MQMRRPAISAVKTWGFDGSNHHIEEWTSKDAEGKLTTDRFDFHRKS